jgi:hypothetical protein
MEGHTMIGMTDKQHRANAADGLRALAGFLEDYNLSAKLNTASRIDVHYTVLEDDDEEAYAEFENLSRFMREVAGYNARNQFRSEVDTGEESNHHIADLIFGAGTVAYRVVWIEKTGDTEDE